MTGDDMIEQARVELEKARIDLMLYGTCGWVETEDGPRRLEVVALYRLSEGRPVSPIGNGRILKAIDVLLREPIEFRKGISR